MVCCVSMADYVSLPKISSNEWQALGLFEHIVRQFEAALAIICKTVPTMKQRSRFAGQNSNPNKTHNPIQGKSERLTFRNSIVAFGSPHKIRRVWWNIGQKGKRERERQKDREGINPFSAKNFRVRKQSYRLLEQEARWRHGLRATIGSRSWIGWFACIFVSSSKER